MPYFIKEYVMPYASLFTHDQAWKVKMSAKTARTADEITEIAKSQ